MLFLYAVIVLFPFLSRFDPYAIHPDHILSSSNATFFFGTDYLGRDILSRFLYAMRRTSMTTLFVISTATVCGLLISLFAALSRIVARGAYFLVDMFVSIPIVLVLIFLASFTQNQNVLLFIGQSMVFIPLVINTSLPVFLSLKTRTYYFMCIQHGRSPLYALTKYGCAELYEKLLVQLPVYASLAIAVETGMGYLGYGVQVPQVNLGVLLAESRTLLFENLGQFLLPLAGTSLFIASLYVLSSALRMYSLHRHA